MLKKYLFLIIFVIIASTVFALPGLKQYSATWDKNVEPDVAGYYLYWRNIGGAFSNTNRIDCKTNIQIVTGVIPSNTEVAVTAYDTSGNESGFSNIIPFDKDQQAPSDVRNLIIK